MVNINRKTLTVDPGEIFLDIKIYMEPGEVTEKRIGAETVSELDNLARKNLKKKTGSGYNGPAVTRVGLNRIWTQEDMEGPGILYVKYKYREGRVAKTTMELLEEDIESMGEFRDAVTAAATKIGVKGSQG